MNLNMLGVEYTISFSNETLCNNFIKHICNCNFINIVKKPFPRNISLLFTDTLIDFESRFSNNNYLYVNDFTCDKGKKYLFKIKDFSVYLDTQNDSVVVYASPQILYKYCFEMFTHLHFKIFYQMNSIMLHAGVVYTSDAVLVFAGESGAGKSTTCARCVLEGTQYLTDENLIFTLDGNNIFLTTLESRLAIRQEAINLFPELNEFAFNSHSERLFVEKFDSNKNNTFLNVDKISTINLVLISKNKVSNQISQLLESTLRRTNGTYMMDEYKINLLQFISMISGNIHVWNPPIDRVAFSQELKNMLQICDKGNVNKFANNYVFRVN